MFEILSEWFELFRRQFRDNLESYFHCMAKCPPCFNTMWHSECPEWKCFIPCLFLLHWQVDQVWVCSTSATKITNRRQIFGLPFLYIHIHASTYNEAQFMVLLLFSSRDESLYDKNKKHYVLKTKQKTHHQSEWFIAAARLTHCRETHTWLCYHGNTHTCKQGLLSLRPRGGEGLGAALESALGHGKSYRPLY